MRSEIGNQNIWHLNKCLVYYNKLKKILTNYKILELEHEMIIDKSIDQLDPCYAKIFPDIYVQSYTGKELVIEIADHLRKEDFDKVFFYKKRSNCIQKWFLHKEKTKQKIFKKFIDFLNKQNIPYSIID